MFDSRKASFDGMLDNNERKIYVSDVIHKAIIEINEAGAEAAASCKYKPSFSILAFLKIYLFLLF